MRIYQSSTHFLDQTGFLVRKYASNRSTYTHSHDFVELVFVLEGQGTHTIDGKDYAIVNGSFFSVDAGQTHSLLFDDNAEYYNIFLSVPFLEQFPLQLDEEKYGYHLVSSYTASPAVYFDQDTAAFISRIFQEINSEFNGQKPLRIETMHTLFRLLLLQVHRVQLEPKDGERTRAYMALPQVLDYINAHFTEPIRLHWLAEKYNYNPAYFGRLFRRSYGISFEAYIQKKRISYAKELLITTDYSVDIILQKIGYTNKNNFYRAFLEDCGCTPKEYRSNEMGVSNQLAVHEKQG